MGSKRNSKETTFIYALIDPTTKQIRYVGKSDDPHGRLVSHLQERGIAEKNQWLKGILSEGQIPEVCILEEVPLRPPYLWQERERWWIAQWHKKGAQLTNRVYRNEAVPKKALIKNRPPHRHWKRHPQPSAACVNLLLSYLTPGRGAFPDVWSTTETAILDHQAVGNILCCEGYPTGTACCITCGRDPDADMIECDLVYETWFCKYTITVPQPLPLGMFPVYRDSEERKTFDYPTEPGIYQTYIWKEQMQDCLDAGCKVRMHHGWAWEAWTEDNKAWIALCQELQEYAPRLEATDNPAWKTRLVFHLAQYLVATPPYAQMLHWFSYTIMQTDRFWYQTTLNRLS